MDTTRLLLRQISGCSMFTVFLLFAIGTVGEKTPIIPPKKLDSAVTSLSPDPSIAAPSTLVEAASVTTSRTMTVDQSITKKVATKDTGSNVSSKTHAVSKLLATESRSKEATPKSTTPLEKPSATEHLDPATAAALQELTTPNQTEVPKSTEDKAEPVGSETTLTAAMATAEAHITKGVQKPHVTVGKSRSSGRPATTVKSTGLMPRSSKGEKETNVTSGQPVQGDPSKQKTRTTTVTSTVRASQADTGVKATPSEDSRVTAMPTPEPGAEKTASPSKGSTEGTKMSTGRTPEPGVEATASPAKTSRGTIVAIVLCILLLLVLLPGLLYCRRRHHTGSTTFKSAAWAGQATLPDDSGMDKEVEQGAPNAGEGETRRATLTTFFGKRQSRLPSVAMEEVAQKEMANAEETQHLMDGEANGKVLESPTQRSRDTEFPPPPANQEDTPPTQQ